MFELLKGISEVLLEVATGLFNHEIEPKEESQDETYEYWIHLSYQEQKEYFEYNEYLRDYMDRDFYENDRHLTAKHVQQIADKLNRKFVNKYERY